MNKDEEVKLLPIGTVITVKEQKERKRLFMIIGYGLAPHGPILTKKGKVENGDIFVFDYMACTYPEGIIDTTVMIGINHYDIDEIVHKGYESDMQKEFCDICAKAIKTHFKNLQAGKMEKKTKPETEEVLEDAPSDETK